MDRNWAGNAEQWPDDDKYTVIWNELVAANKLVGTSEFNDGVYEGLLRAYCRLTGDTADQVDVKICAATRVANPVLGLVPS